jgi:hypothetical protein
MHMVTPELLDFLREQLATGVSSVELERMLVNEGGWEKADVEEGLAKIGVSPAPVSVQVPAAPIASTRVESMDVASASISAPQQIPIIDSPQIESSTPAEFPKQETLQPKVESTPVVLSVRSERTPDIAPVDDFLGIFDASSLPNEAVTPQPAQTPVAVTESLIRVDPQQVAIREVAKPPEEKKPEVTPNLMDMLATVSAPSEISAAPLESSSAVTPTTPMVKFDLSRIKQDKPVEAVVSASPAPTTQPDAMPPVVAAPATAPVIDKPVQTHSVAELWLSQGKVEAQPAEDAVKEKELRASLSSRRTMASDMLLRGKGAVIQGLPALLPTEDTNPMPQYSSRKVEEAKKVVEEKRAAKEKPKLTVAEELTRKNKIKKFIGVAVGILVTLALVAGGAVAFISMRGPDVGTLLSTTMGQYFSATSFTYIGNASSDLILTSKAADGVTRNGAVKFSLDYAGELKNDKYGYGDGNHRLKWTGGLSSGNFFWSTDIESDLRMSGTDLYFHVLSFPSQSDIDPDLFKTYWIKVDIAEIAKELSLDSVTTGDSYNGIAGTESTTFNAIVEKNMPFIGGEKIGSETLNGVEVTHFALKTDPEKMFTLANDLYKKFLGKTFSVNTEEKLRMMNALEKLKFEIWVDEKTDTLVQVKLSGELDDDIEDIHAKGPISLSFMFSKQGVPVSVTVPAPFLTLDELHTRMNDFKKFREVRSRDAVYINGLGEVEHALGSYMSAKGRYPTVLSELRADNMLSTSTLSDDLLKLYSYAAYVKEGDFTKANKCVQRSKTCGTYHIGVNLDDLTDPQLANDADQNSDVRGADTTGCSLEREKACYDILFTATASGASATSSKVNL